MATSPEPLDLRKEAVLAGAAVKAERGPPGATETARSGL